jgi:8-oxo-dGTP pyrophosphatase MutT (NUDIX family)
MTSKKAYCVNCGKVGHNIKECIEPVISYGVICIKLDKEFQLYTSLIEKYLLNNLIDLDEFNFVNLSNISKIEYYKDKIKFLLIQRKHSFSYVEFIRGKYDDKNISEVSKILNLMTLEEIENIMTLEFGELWEQLWRKTSKHKAYQKEFELSKEKFEYIKSTYDLYSLIKIDELYETPEWGFPKGRRDKNEKNLDCAMREFKEETSIDSENYTILNRLGIVEENVIGTENTNYKLIYYLGLMLKDIEPIRDNQNYEIGDIKWLSFDELISKIRPYFDDKIKMIYKVFFLFINLLENIKTTIKIDNISY